MLNNFTTKIVILWPTNIYPCVPYYCVMYCTIIVHKLTQPRKSLNCSTKTTPGIPP